MNREWQCDMSMALKLVEYAAILYSMASYAMMSIKLKIESLENDLPNLWWSKQIKNDESQRSQEYR